MDNLPDVRIIVLNYNAGRLTVNCLGSVLGIEYPNFKVTVVDNASTDDSVARIKAAATDPRVELLINDKNQGYAGGNNRGIEKALSEGAEYVFVLNNDTVVDPGCLSSLVTAFQHDPRIGIAGCKIVDFGHESRPNLGQRISFFTGNTGPWPHAGPATGPVDVDFICGAAIMLRADTLHEVGAFDSNFFLYSEDADICFRARKAGYRTCFIPGPGIWHLSGATTGSAPIRALVYFYRHRNQIWIIRRHAKPQYRIVFALLTFCYQYPKILLGRVLRQEFYLLRPFLKAVCDGYRGYSGYSGGRLQLPQQRVLPSSHTEAHSAGELIS